jgi:hypothetical protein
MNDLVIRPPKPIVIVSTVMLIFMLAIGVRIAIATGGDPFILVWLAGVVVAGTANLGRNVRTSGDTLRIRNFLRVHEFARDDIERFVLFTPSMRGAARLVPSRTGSVGTVVTVLMSNGRAAPLEATRRLFASADVERIRQALEVWRTGSGAFSRT